MDVMCAGLYMPACPHKHACMGTSIYVRIFFARPKRRVGRNALALDSQAARRRHKQTRGDDGRNARALDNQCYVARYTQKWQEGDVAKGKGRWTRGVVHVVGGDSNKNTLAKGKGCWTRGVTVVIRGVTQARQQLFYIKERPT